VLPSLGETGKYRVGRPMTLSDSNQARENAVHSMSLQPHTPYLVTPYGPEKYFFASIGSSISNTSGTRVKIKISAALKCVAWAH
jgi:hypothetical protein